MMLFETRAPDAPRPAGPHDGAALAPLHAPLDDALHLLQADPGHSLADPGLARLTPAGLDRLFVAACQQVERSHQGILLLLDLLQLAQPADPATASRLVAGMARQLRHHLEDQQRWQTLADNAAYYRDNRQVAERIAARLLQE